MSTPISKLVNATFEDKGITIQDIAKCTGNWGGVKGRIVRFFNRLATLNKGWITDDKVNKILSHLNETQKQNIAKKMEEAKASLVETERKTDWPHDTKKIEMRLDKFDKITQGLLGISAKDQLKVENIISPLRLISLYTLFSNPESTLAKQFAEFLFTRKQTLNVTNYQEMYQSFVAAIGDKIGKHANNDLLLEQDKRTVMLIIDSVLAKPSNKNKTLDVLINEFNIEINKLEDPSQRLFSPLFELPNDS